MASPARGANEHGPRVGVVVLSWNRREDTLACLRSLDRVGYEPMDVVVVDNGSSDGSAEAVRGEFERAELIALETNRGFAGGNNAGIRRALELGAEHVLVLNNDTEVEPGAVSALVEAAASRPDAASLGAKILYAARPELIWFVGADFDPRRGYNGRRAGYRERDGERFAGVLETQVACGAAMLVPGPVLEKVGLFDEDLFAYSEDLDWSLRARAAGLRHYVVGASRVRHRVSISSGGENAPATLYYGIRNTLTVCERHAPLTPAAAWRRRLVSLAAHAAQALRSGRRREGLRAVANGWRDFRRGRLGGRPVRA
ncbi:MAG: glycosyltransferase family 2 protein [Gaiellaceae bacterium]